METMEEHYSETCSLSLKLRPAQSLAQLGTTYTQRARFSHISQQPKQLPPHRDTGQPDLDSPSVETHSLPS